MPSEIQSKQEIEAAIAAYAKKKATERARKNSCEKPKRKKEMCSAAQRARHREYNRKYREAHREYYLEYNRWRRNALKEQINAARRERYRQDSEYSAKVRADSLRYYHEHKEEINARQRERRRMKREQIKAAQEGQQS